MPSTGHPLVDLLLFLLLPGSLAGWIGRLVHRKAIKPVVDGVKALSDVPERLSQVETKVDTIDERTKQLEPNHGTSLHDRVTGMDSRLEGVEITQHEIFTELRPMVTALGIWVRRENAAAKAKPRTPAKRGTT